MNSIQQEITMIPTKIFKNAQWISKSLSVNKRKSPNYPCKRWGHTAVLHDKYMYVFSGCGKSDNPRQWEQIYRMDCITFQWERLNSPSQNHPPGRDSHCCVCLQNKLYFFGGSSNELILGDFWSFDIETSEWTEIQVPKDMEAREGHSMVALSSRLIYIYGGWDQVQNIMTESHWLYDIKTNKFQQVTHFTGDEMIKLESHTANKIGDSVYIFGGQGQQSNKQLVFHKDLYKLDFENINDLHSKFDQLESGDDKGQNIENNTVIKIEKIKANGSQQPTPRASHSAVTYGERFLFIIGGEGYQYDQQKDNEEEAIEQDQDDDQNIDEEEKPIFPKNDIWIFETLMRTWSKLQPKSKTPVFQPRFSHSCIVYKDQFIIFGGLRSMGEVLEDIMVLHLKDSENNIQKYSRDEMKNVCKYCQLIYGIQQEEEISFHKTIENNAIKLPKLSLTFVDEISKLIYCPMSCFGLFLDNVKLSEASEVNFEYVFLQRKKKYQNTIDEIRDKIPVLIIFEKDPRELDDLNDFLFNFDISKRKNKVINQDIDLKNESEQNQVYEEQQLLNKKQYALNFKIASLRLGDSVLICHKSQNNYYVGLISMNDQLNPNDETLTFYNYTITIANGTEKKIDSPESKYVLLNAITHLINEEDFILNCNYNYTKIFIFDLARIHALQKIFELHLYNDDIISNQFLAYQLKKDDAIKYPDFSLKEYLKYYSLEHLPFKITVQNQLINTNVNVISRIDNKNKISISNEKILIKLNEWAESYQISRLTQNNFGILLYYQGRLINRYRKQLGVYPNNLEQSGYINISKIVKPNMTFEGFKNSYLSSILLQTLEILEEECEPERRKEIKI
ncbi:unnamed protein product [Paramecium primaurelia]|uniref:Uncharacterized protein n=1 Tax=Paramecium primaurelia TaxID=5886 RepID=A0A8S1PYE8_PARPR|nr:unnamed protein product [Paramecium primaurelia]